MSLWYEPESLEKLSDIGVEHDKDIPRFFTYRRMEIIDSKRKLYDFTRGKVMLHFNQDYSKISLQYACQRLIDKVNPEDVSFRVFQFSKTKSLTFYDTSLKKFRIGSKVEIGTKEEIISAFEYVGRDDYFDYMD